MSSGNENQKTQPTGGAVNAPPSGIGAPAPLTPSENLADFQSTYQLFIEDLSPRGIVEQTLVFQLAATAWRLRRLPFLESVIFSTLFQRGSAWKELEIIGRHESRLVRTFERILRDVESRHGVRAPKPESKTETQPARPPAAPPPPPPNLSYRAAAPATPAPSTLPAQMPLRPATPAAPLAASPPAA